MNFKIEIYDNFSSSFLKKVKRMKMLKKFERKLCQYLKYTHDIHSGERNEEKILVQKSKRQIIHF